MEGDTVRSLFWSLVLVGQTIGIRGIASPPLVEASSGGSELPWFTPLLVSLALLVVAAVYRLRHRSGAGPGDKRTAPNGFGNGESEIESGYPGAWSPPPLLQRG